MKRLLQVVVVLLAVLSVAKFGYADRIVSDPSPGLVGMEYEIWQAAKGLVDTQVVATGKLVVSKLYEVDGSVNYVIDYLVPGTYAWYFRTAGKAYVYGPSDTSGGSTLYSVFVPFNFTKRSSVVGSIPGLRLAP